jgi:hypothetical protein
MDRWRRRTHTLTRPPCPERRTDRPSSSASPTNHARRPDAATVRPRPALAHERASMTLGQALAGILLRAPSDNLGRRRRATYPCRRVSTIGHQEVSRPASTTVWASSTTTARPKRQRRPSLCEVKKRGRVGERIPSPVNSELVPRHADSDGLVCFRTRAGTLLRLIGWNPPRRTAADGRATVAQPHAHHITCGVALAG